MTFQFLFYVFLSIVLIAGGGYYFFSSRQETTAAIYFIGAIVAAVFFGLRWFSPSGDINVPSATAWPPSINYCPDFLTLMTINGTQACVDTVGAATVLQTSDGTQTGSQYIFDLSLSLSDKPRAKALCDSAKEAGVTWEGLWDGTSCTNVEPPRPPTVTVV